MNGAELDERRGLVRGREWTTWGEEGQSAESTPPNHTLYRAQENQIYLRSFTDGLFIFFEDQAEPDGRLRERTWMKP